MAGSFAIVLNCAARDRRAAGRREEVVRALASEGLDARLFCAEDGRDVGLLARRAAKQGYPVVVAAGGDGTVGAVAAAIAGTDTALGVLPFGTINHFAKSMGIPGSLAAAAHTLAGGRVIRVDAGEVDGRLFVNNSTFGIHPSVIKYRDELRRRRGMNKWVAYALAAAALVPRHEIAEVRLFAGDREILVETPFVFVGTHDYRVGDLDLGGGAEPGPGELGVGVARAASRLSVVRLLGAAALGRAHRAKDFERFPCLEMRVESAAPAVLVALDGEVVEMAPPLHYRVRPGALRVVVPGPREGRVSPAPSPRARAPRREAPAPRR